MKTLRYKTICWIARSFFSLLLLILISHGAAAQTNTFPSSGNVGIGTTSPVNALDVGTASAGSFQGTSITASSNSAVSTVGVGQSQTARGRMKWHYNATEASSFMSLSVSGGLQPLVLQDAGGGVGIGMIPVYTLDVNGGVNAFRIKAASGASNDTIATFENSSAIQMILRANGNLGIGTTSPGEKLVTIGNTLSGNITSHTQLYSTYDSQANSVFELGYGTATSNITPLPYFVLSKNLTSTNNAAGVIAFANSSIANGNDKRLSGIGSWTDGATNSGTLQFFTSSAGTFSERLRITSGGNVGIGTSSPGGPIDIRDSSGRQLLWNMAGAGHSFLNANGGNVHVAGNLYFNGTVWNRFNTGAAGGMWWAGNDGTLGVLQVGAGANPVAAFSWPFFINTSGYVGIGHNNPTYRLDVQNGAVNASGGFCIAGDCKTAWSQMGSQWGTSGSNLNYNSGNVGIGVDSPALQSGTANKIVEIRGSVNPGVALTSTAAGGRQFFVYSSQTNPGYFSVFDATATADRFAIDSSGRVGIGTTTPASSLQIGTQTSGASASPVTLSLGGSFSNSAGSNLKLRLYDDGIAGNMYGIGVSSGSMDFGVSPSAGYHWYSGGTNKMTLTTNGDLSVSGAINAKYQDVAEWVQSSEQLAAGTVVILDANKSNHVISSTQAYDTSVAGVISAQPGIALGERGADKVLVATTGRVRVRVDASGGPIRIGDLLVTSDIAGVAMKSDPVNLGGVKFHRPGTIIGKALEPLAKGSGEILVLLSLQ